MKRPRAFHPSVVALERREMLSAIYSTATQNSEQASYVAQAKQAVNPVVFIGDSITYNWGTSSRQAPGSSVFSEDFAGLGAANFGIPGDTTAQVLARVEAGDLAGKPKVAVLLIGINDLGRGESPLQTATGVLEDVEAIHAASPQSTVLLLGVLPTDVGVLNPGVQQLDKLISVIGNLPGVIYENPGTLFLGSNGAANPNLLYDQEVHPNQAGYDLIAGAIDGTVIKLLQEADHVSVRPVATPRPPTQVPVSAVSITKVIGLNAGLLIPSVATVDASTEVVAASSTAKTKSQATELINVLTG